MISAYCSGTFNAYPLVPLANGARCGNNPKRRRCASRSCAQNVSQLGEAASAGGFVLHLDLEAALLLLVHGIEQEFVHFCPRA
jgi:hypothetical protein